MTGPLTVDAEPSPYSFDPASTALLVIDMQRDFLEPGGFGDSLGNDVSQLRRTIAPLQRLLAAWRGYGLPVIHTREGHLPDLSDCPPAKLSRGAPSRRIGDPGPNGRILVRGEYGHAIVDELAPLPDEPVIDKPGKGAFHATDLTDRLAAAGVRSLVVAGVTTEVCVHTTVREANDRGYDCLVLADCVGSYFPEFHRLGLQMITAQGGIFGWVATSAALLDALAAGMPRAGSAARREPPGHADRADVVAEVAAAFADYEQALVADDVDRVVGWFWDSADTVRFGIADHQVGLDEQRRWRSAQPPLPAGRRLHDTRISMFGTDFAVVTTFFTYPGGDTPGRQSQTWVRLPVGWRIVTAHVSQHS